MSRSIGDKDYKSYIISEPETVAIDLGSNDQFLILASDGIFRTYSKSLVTSTVIDMKIKGYSNGQITKLICEKSVNDGCTDNVTLMIIDVNPYFEAHKIRRHRHAEEPQ